MHNFREENIYGQSMLYASISYMYLGLKLLPLFLRNTTGSLL